MVVTVMEAKAVLLLAIFDKLGAWPTRGSVSSDCEYNELVDESCMAEQLLEDGKDVLLPFLVG